MRFKNNFKQDKGMAGLTILLSLITFLFVIGFIVMVFSLMGGELKDSTSLSASDSASTTQDTVVVNETGTALTTCGTFNQGAISVVTVINDTGETIASGNFSYSVCNLTYTGAGDYNNTDWNVTYTYTFAGTSWDVINDTIEGVGGAVDWFDIFIVIGSMVVLILLTVIIIISIRGSGLMGGVESTQGSNRNIGSA
jgi:hypothetical protein